MLKAQRMSIRGKRAGTTPSPAAALAALFILSKCSPVGTPAPTSPAAPAEAGPAAAPPGAPSAAGGAAAPAAESAEEPKFDFEAMLARERPALPLLAVTDVQGRWRSQIESRRPPLVADHESQVSVRVNLGTKEELRCEVHTGQLNPGAALTNLLSAAGQTVALERVEVYDVRSAALAPVLFVRALYETRDEQALGGELKLALSPGAEHSFICLHDEPGYRETFARVVQGFVGAFESAAPRRFAQHAAVWQLSDAEGKTGYSWERIFAELDGTMTSFKFDVLLDELPSGGVRIRDYMAAEVHDRRGLLRGNYLSYRGTTKAHEIVLAKTDGGAWALEGTLEGKPLEGQLPAGAKPASDYELYTRLNELRAGGGERAFRLDEYRPERDPRQLSTVAYRLEESGVLSVTQGGRVERWKLDAGLPSQRPVLLGGATFSAERRALKSSLGSEPLVTVGEQPTPEPSAPFPLAERRAKHETYVFGEADRTPAKAPPSGVLSKTTYAAPLGANVAYVTPVRPGARRPAVIWIGSGLDWGIGESAWARSSKEGDPSGRAFREQGLVLMLPALRGSNENPGQNECFLGEVDDILAAADHLATRPDVDPSRIYLAGNATGGTLALLSAASTARFRAVFAFGPVADARQYGTPSGGGCLPENASPEDIELRAPIAFVGSIRTPTYVFEGGSGSAELLDALRERASSSVHFAVVPGATPAGIVGPGTQVIARAIAAGEVDDEHLVIDLGPPNGRGR